MTPVGALLILALLSASGWAFTSLVRRLRRAHVSARWWVALAGLVMIGLLVGVWCAFRCEYHWGHRYRVASFPVPVVFFHLEDGDWVDFPVARAQALAIAIADMISVTALATLPLWVVSWRQHRHERKNDSQQAATANAG